jgi:hypothetical protein
VSRNWVLWVLAGVVTLTSAVWQRLSGPTYPVRGTLELGEVQVKLRLTRSHGGEGGQPVRVLAPDASLAGEVAWRRYPTEDPWTVIPLRRAGDWLEAELPQQPPAGKLEYQVHLRRGGEEAVFPPRPAITRFKGDVPAWLLIPHVLAMFLGMVFSNRAGLEALVRGPRMARYGYWAVILIGLGGFLLGPAVQQAAFGAWWTGVPFGWDLTDNKTLVAGVAWGWAVWRMGSGRSARGAVLAAALVTLAIFIIPHSTWGSQLDWSSLEPPAP